MSPFLAEVNVINLAGDSHGTATPDGYADAVTELHASLARASAEAKAEIAAATKKAREETAQLKSDAMQVKEDAAQAKEDADNDEDSGGDKSVTITHGGKSIVVHHSKSKSNSDEDMVYAAIPIVAIVFTFIYLIIRALMAPFTNRNKRGIPAPMYMQGLNEEEAALLEKLQRTLTQMESRVESLETILIDPARTKEKYGSKL